MVPAAFPAYCAGRRYGGERVRRAPDRARASSGSTSPATARRARPSGAWRAGRPRPIAQHALPCAAVRPFNCAGAGKGRRGGAKRSGRLRGAPGRRISSRRRNRGAIRLKVSIAIPAYNAERRLDECVRSALDQTYSDTEIIAVNDGSADSTPEILEGYADRIRVHRKKTGGTASALNLGYRKISGDRFKRLGADDALKPHAVAALVGAVLPPGRLGNHAFYARHDHTGGRGGWVRRLVVIEPKYNHEGGLEHSAILSLHFCGNGITSMFCRAVSGGCGPSGSAVEYPGDCEFRLRCCMLHGLRLVPRNIARYRIHGPDIASAHAGEAGDKDDRTRFAIPTRPPPAASPTGWTGRRGIRPAEPGRTAGAMQAGGAARTQPQKPTPLFKRTAGAMPAGGAPGGRGPA